MVRAITCGQEVSKEERVGGLHLGTRSTLGVVEVKKRQRRQSLSRGEQQRAAKNGNATECETCSQRTEPPPRNSSQNKGCVPAPRSAAPQSICCFCSTLLRSAASSSCNPHPSSSLPLHKHVTFRSSSSLTCSVPPTFFAPVDYVSSRRPSVTRLHIWRLNSDHIQFTINHRPVVRMNRKHNHVWLQQDLQRLCCVTPEGEIPGLILILVWACRDSEGPYKSCSNLHHL